MKILFLCPDPGIPVLGRKGAAVHVREFAHALVRAGHEVVLAAQTLNKSSWETPAEFQAHLLQIQPNPAAAAAVAAFKEFNETVGGPGSLPGALRRILYNRELQNELKRRFESDPPDLIYERASLYATAGLALARALGRPLILELNAPLAMEQQRYRATGFTELASQAERHALSGADAIVVVSAALRDHVLALGVSAGRVHVLPNGVNLARFHTAPPDAAVRKGLNLDGGPVIGFVGGLRQWHGVEVLPELFQRLSARHRDLQLVIAGDGPLRGELERGLEIRGLRSRTVMTGLVPHEQVPGVIRQFDIALAPYPQLEHAFYFSPLKLFEYMACGVPVVAAELGQIAEIVHSGETGFLYPAGNLEEMEACCERLLADRELRQKMGQAAAARVRQQFTWDHNAARVLELARSLRPATRVGGP